MNRSGLRRLLWLIIGIAVLAVVGVVAYSFGVAASHGAAHTAVGPFRGNYAYALGFGAGPFGLLAAVLFGFVLIWLFVALISGPAVGPHRESTDPAGVDRLRDLSEIHDKGALTDEEFTAAKRRLLGL
jgi:uncharacterized membrane protein